jgi:UDP-2-acetamido-2,6-beta-L-arabino-hexul-4-ose reductase
VLGRRDDIELYKYDLNSDISELYEALQQVGCIIHLAGVNRPEDPKEFETGNVGSIKDICDKLKDIGRTPKIILSSSIQAVLDNPYGVIACPGNHDSIFLTLIIENMSQFTFCEDQDFRYML